MREEPAVKDDDGAIGCARAGLILLLVCLLFWGIVFWWIA
jgi:hypothetical protein